MKFRSLFASLLFGISLVVAFPKVTQAQSTVEVPFTVKNSRIGIIAEYDRKHRFELGVSLFHPSAIDVMHPAFNNRIRQGTRRQIGVSTSYSPTSVIPAFRVGDFLISDLEVYWDAPYLLGFDFFKKNVVQIDYRSRKIKFFNDSSYKPAFDVTVEPDKKAVIRVKVRERIEVTPTCRVLSEDVLVDGKKAKVLIALDANSNRADGQVFAQSKKVTLEIGNLKLASVPVLDANSSDYEYILDISILGRDGITIDLRNKRIAFAID